MTNAEAREHLKDILCDVPNDKCIDWIEALNTAIKALEDKGYEQGYKDGYIKGYEEGVVLG